MNNNLVALGMKAESLGIYAVESKDPRIVYFYNDGEYAICTKGFVWRFSEEEAEEIAEGFRGAMKSTVLKELREIIEDVQYLRKTGVRT